MADELQAGYLRIARKTKALRIPSAFAFKG